MKTILSLMAVFCCIHSFYAQRQMNVKVELISPLENTTFTVNQAVDFTLKITNLGETPLQPSDSLRMHFTLNDAPMIFMPANDSFDYKTGIEILPNASYNMDYLIMFTEGFISDDMEVCFNLMPINRVNPIVELDPLDNVSCKTYVVQEANVGLETLQDEVLNWSPNPAQEQIQLTQFASDVNLYSMNGQLLFSSNHTQRIDVSEFESGMYVLRYHIKGKLLQQRIVIQ